MSTCKPATPRPQASKDRKLKIWHNDPNNLPQETDQGLFEILPVRWENRLWMWTQVVKNGQNRYFCGKLNNFFLRPARELIFSLKYSSLLVLTGKYHPRPGKNLYVEKNDHKVTKIRFFGHGLLTTFRKSHFRPWILKITITKYTLSETTSKTACKDLLIFFWRLC